MSVDTPTREAWMLSALDDLREIFGAADLKVPEVRVSVGWPSRRAMSLVQRTIGECWHGQAAADGVTQIFVSPVLADPVEVLDTLTHELLHAALPKDTGHKGAFKRSMALVGLTGKPTEASAGPELTETLKGIAKKLGPFDHSKLTAGGFPKQTTRLVKAECDLCGYNVRVTRKWLDEAGAPICPSDQTQMTEAS